MAAIKKLNTEKINFLTTKGIKSPKFIYECEDNFGNTLQQLTKKSLKKVIERNNRVFSKNPQLLNL